MSTYVHLTPDVATSLKFANKVVPVVGEIVFQDGFIRFKLTARYSRTLSQNEYIVPCHGLCGIVITPDDIE